MKIVFFEIRPEEQEALKKILRGHTVYFVKAPLNKATLSHAKNAEIISLFIYSKITSDLLRNLPKLRFITTRSMGFDHIDLDACKKADIKVSNAPHYGDNSVAEHTFALILALSRKVSNAHLRISNGNYSILGLEGFDLKGKTLGVIGTGRIGSNVIRIARGFEMNILATDIFPRKELVQQFKFSYVPLKSLLKNSDIITLHAPYMKENHHMFNKGTFALVKPGALFINTARGQLVDTVALVQALESGKLSGAGLDVLEGEELIKEKVISYKYRNLTTKQKNQLAFIHRILYNENVVFTPHIAFYSKEAVHRILEVTSENIQAYLKGKPINLIT